MRGDQYWHLRALSPETHGDVAKTRMDPGPEP